MKNFLFFLFYLFSISALGQEKIHLIKGVQKHQKCWAFSHPFVAGRAYRISQRAIAATQEMIKDKSIDGDLNGGEADAFKHSLWMALLAQKIRWKKALRLGIAHEKDNFLEYKKNLAEDGEHPDSVSGAMDLFNNSIGAEIGKTNRKATEKEITQVIKQEIINGKMKVIMKNENGEYIDCSGKIIRMAEWKGLWNVPKCLVPSGYKKKNEK